MVLIERHAFLIFDPKTGVARSPWFLVSNYKSADSISRI